MMSFRINKTNIVEYRYTSIMIKKNLTLFGLAMIFISTFAGNNKDSSTVSPKWLEKLDSSTAQWYMRKSEHAQYQHPAKYDSVIPTFPDSVYKSRILALNSIIPLSYNGIVRNFIHVYTDKKRDKLEKILGLAPHYFPFIEEVLDAHDLPIELRYMPVIESALTPTAVSRAGATGMWQFMYGTGKMYNLTINSHIDERRDPVKSTYAACHFLKDLYKMYNDWILVIAAYNCGPGNVNKAIRRAGGRRNYWDIYYYLPRETRGYVPAFIAAMYAMNYHHEHHIRPAEVKMPQLTDTITIRDRLHLKQVSEVLTLPLEEIKELNPQYRANIIPGHIKPYSLKLPMQEASRFIELQDSIIGYNDSLFFDYNNINRTPERYTASKHYHKSPGSHYQKLIYTVKTGDNLGFIAEWYDVRASDIRHWNNIYGNLIKRGQKLAIYVPKNKASRYKNIDQQTFNEKQRRVAGEIRKTEAKASVKTQQNNDFIYYTIQSGDTLWEIAKKYQGISDLDIMKINNISGSKSIKPGQVIKIKRKG